MRALLHAWRCCIRILRVCRYVIANLDEMLPRLDVAASEAAPTQQELDDAFGPASLGLPTSCPPALPGADATSTATLVGLVLFGVVLGVGLHAAIVSCSCCHTSRNGGYSKV